MTHTAQTRLHRGRVRNISCDFLGSPSHQTCTSHDRQAQRLVRRFGVSRSVAGLVASLAFGGCAHD